MAEPPRHRWEVRPWSGPPGEVHALARYAAAEDGHWPLSEQADLDLRAGRAGESLAVRGSSGELLGIAVVEPRAADGGRTVHLVVEPRGRRQGIARALLGHVRAAAGSAELTLWAHGASPAAMAFAASLAVPVSRRLLTLGLRPEGRLARDAPWRPRGPHGVKIRAFSEERGDQAALTVLNRRAFAEHPDQGRLTQGDLAERMTEPWFDPAGLLLAEKAARVVGFHWTKVMPRAVPDDRRQGEVYVLGVDPGVRRLGLGRTLLEAGLDALARKGVDDVVVYVEADNHAAVALYRSTGFTPRSLDLAYLVPGQRQGPRSPALV